MSDDLWFEGDGGITHWCGGTTDKKKSNKPDLKVTQTDMTKWFNPTALDKDTGVLRCMACGGSPKDGESKTTIESGE